MTVQTVATLKEHGLACADLCARCSTLGPVTGSRGTAIDAALAAGWHETYPTGGPPLRVCPRCIRTVHHTLRGPL